MNRLSWDTTAPRRPSRKRVAHSPQREPDNLVDAEAELIRVAWDRPHRLTGI